MIILATKENQIIQPKDFIKFDTILIESEKLYTLKPHENGLYYMPDLKGRNIYTLTFQGNIESDSAVNLGIKAFGFVLPETEIHLLHSDHVITMTGIKNPDVAMGNDILVMNIGNEPFTVKANATLIIKE